MSRPLGSKNKIGRTVKAQIEKSFYELNKDGSYLKRLAKNHPAVYMGVVGKLIPTELKAQVEHHVLDLGLAMSEARARLNAPDVVDVTPNPLITNDSGMLDDLLD